MAEKGVANKLPCCSPCYLNTWRLYFTYKRLTELLTLVQQTAPPSLLSISALMAGAALLSSCRFLQ